MNARDKDFPEVIHTEAELDELMTRPRHALIDFIDSVRSPLVILGAGGKMGPSLAVLACRAAQAAKKELEIIAVSRFSDPRARLQLEQAGVHTQSVDLLSRDSLESLPDATNVIYLVGLKFGTSDNPAPTWAINTLVPANVSERYANAQIVALSTGNVYPLTPVSRNGSVESDRLTPLGEYPNAAVARERIFEFFSQKHAISIALIRLNYALDLRYGVLVDIARKVYCGESVDVTMGYLNCIWQGDANEMILRALALTQSPPMAFNLTSPVHYSVRSLAKRFGELFGKEPHIIGTESETALLSNASRICQLLGAPPTPIERIVTWTAHWIMHGGRSLNKPAHFDVRDGKY